MEAFVNFSRFSESKENMHEAALQGEEDALIGEIIEFNRENGLLPHKPDGLLELTLFYPDIVNSMEDHQQTNLILSIFSPFYMKEGGNILDHPQNHAPFSLVFIIIECENEDFPMDKEEFVMMFIVENALDISDFD